MRDIKFRAWDKKTEMMYAADKIDPVGSLIAQAFSLKVFKDRGGHFGYDLARDSKKNFIFMQYTGLKDKNGVEIYKDDVVERYWTDGSVVNRIHVRWIEQQAGWNLNPQLLSATKFNQQTGMTAHGFKVVGNVHENPEILTTNN